MATKGENIFSGDTGRYSIPCKREKISCGSAWPKASYSREHYNTEASSRAIQVVACIMYGDKVPLDCV